MDTSTKPLYGIVSQDGGHCKLVFCPRDHGDLIPRPQMYGEGVELFREHAGSEIPIVDLRTLREPLIPAGVKEEYSRSARYIPFRPSLEEFTKEAVLKGAIVWPLSNENYQYVKTTGFTPGLKDDVGESRPPTPEEVTRLLDQADGASLVADSIRKARLNDEFANTVCTWLHEGTGMYHFEGTDAVDLVAPSLGVDPPGTSVVDPASPFGTMGVHEDVIASKSGKLHLVTVPSIFHLKAVQIALDADRSRIARHANATAALPSAPRDCEDALERDR